MLDLRTLGPKDVIFTHINERDVTRHWCVNRMYDWCVQTKMEVIRFEVEADYAMVCMRSRGIEMPRVYRLKPEHLKIPCLYVDMGDGTSLLVDGNHRYVRAWMTDVKTLRAFHLSQEDSSKFLIKGIPAGIDTKASLQNSFSGLY